MFFPKGLVALPIAITIALISAYAMYQSILSMANVKKYESKAEKAAEWSNTARDRLWDTRYTIGTGFLSCLVSLITAALYILLVPAGSTGSSVLAAPLWTMWPAVLALGLRFGASRYMHKFWATKDKVPLVDQYNAAISQSMHVISLLDLLSAGWAVLAVLKALSL
ncbi:hypothetical protein DHEL01_v211977 [Diaporthe helianthi]|uniref:Uncharacterized protein n=1 Tax=Diaporthe helianthi TaxID=158607 RepID=A0A2P5HHA5_DIAHE|nr:hypothetical protein DHEL01_v211977 [Diaporthe helianthi]